MKIKTLGQVNERSVAGRVYSAGLGRVTEVDDADTDMVDLFKQLVARGLAEIVKDVKKQAEQEPDAPPALPTNEELREDLRDRGLPVSGNKDELTERLAEDDKAQAAAEKPAKKSTAAKAAGDE